MSIRLTGEKTRVVKHMQERLDHFAKCSKSFENTRNNLDVWAAKKIELADIPTHETRYQTLLSEYKKATEDLKAAALSLYGKTDNAHIKKYFNPRHSVINGDYRYINYAYKQPLQTLHQVTWNIVNTDYATPITQANNESQKRFQEAQAAIEHFRKEAEAAREFSVIDQTFPSCCERLIKENPSEYLRQSNLYQNKLLEKKNPTTALAFGKSWIKTLPKEATWEQVENMSFIMLKAAQNIDSAELTEYRMSVEQWLKEHPLPEKIDSPPLTPDQATSSRGRRTYALGLLYLYDGTLDLSPEALQLYQNCSLLYPEQHSWKVAQAFCHMSKIQWSTAEQLLANLPKDDPSVTKAQKILADNQHAWNIVQKVSEAFDHMSKYEWSTAEQLLANLPKDNPSVVEAQKALAKNQNAWNVAQKITQAFGHMSKFDWSAAEQLLANLPKDDPSVLDAQKVLADNQNAWNVAQKITQAFDHMSKFNWSAAEQSLAELPKDDPSVVKAQKILADNQNAWNVAQKITQAYDRMSKFDWSAAEQLLANLPKDDPSVVEAQKILAKNRNAWNIAQKITEASDHVSKFDWSAAEQSLADLPKDDPSVVKAQKDLADIRKAWNLSQKLNQAFDHIFNLEWLEAKQLLADLPQDNSSVTKAQKLLANSLRERICSAGLDLGVIAFSRWVPYSYRETLKFDIANTAIQLFSNPSVRKIWLPRLLGTSKSSIPARYFLSSSVTLVGDIVDCVFRNINGLGHLQKAESCVSSIVRMANMARTIYSHPQQRNLLSWMNLGSSLISVGQTYDAYRETRRPITLQAFLSTVHQITSDVSAASVILSYTDLLPLMGIRSQQIADKIGSKRLIDQIFSDSSQKIFRRTGLATIVGAIAAYRLCFDYPYLWATYVMKEAELYCFQRKYEDANRVLAEAENSYFVSKAKPAVRSYANYVKQLEDYPNCLKDPTKYKEFQKFLDIALVALKPISYFRGLRNNLLLRKMEIAIRQQELDRLKEVVKENPADKIIEIGFHFLLSCTFYLSLKDPVKACTFLQKMGIVFPQSFHSIIDSFLKLLQAHSKSLQDWSQLNLLALQNPPSQEKVKQWNNAFLEVQSFFHENVGKIGAYQDLQYYRLIISFAHTNNNEQTQAFFKELGVEIHERFFQELVLYTKHSRKIGRHKDAIHMLKRIQSTSFKDNTLIQHYAHFFALLYSPCSRDDSFLEQMKTLDSCIDGLEKKDDFHKELRVFFCACKVVLNLDAGEYSNAKNLLAKELPDSEVPSEVAALLFERVYFSLQENKNEKAVSDLTVIVEKLGSWQHQRLFEFFRGYLLQLREPAPLEIHLKCLTSVIEQLSPIEQLTAFTFNLQLQRDRLQLELYLSQEKFEEAKNLISSRSKEHPLELCKILPLFLINRGEELRPTKQLRHVKKILQDLGQFFAIPNELIKSYLNFLGHLENIEGKRELAAYEKACESLNAVLKMLESIQCPVPSSLIREKVNILLEIANLAEEAGHLKTALAALESVKTIGARNEHLDQYIINLKEQLSVYSR